ncbi:uncharacterized protein LOC118194004 isoform X2 [Stegodyphus dumicola]|nr:uncharacterized protein LOC118194004 isoform X2 [Stegodyphus dumicola]XP_035221070.1 uncharacterized protein LOC118194004 isoform X2 [Stegodyphus dumicola]
MDRNRSAYETSIKDDFDEYLSKIRNEKEWAGEVEMKALSCKYNIDFIIYNAATKPPLKIRTASPIQHVMLACTGNNRYDCVYSKSDLSALAFCQSLVYEILYKRVFELGSDVDIAVEKMLHDKAYSKQRRNNLLNQLFKENCCIESVKEDHNLPEDDQLIFKNPRFEIRRALAQGVPPFPYKVAKTLDPNIYRNVEFDMWNEKRKEEQKSEQFVVPKLEPGVKCKVYINKEIYIGHVQDILSDSEDVSVYIEELCKRCVVSSNVIEIVPVPAYKALTWQGGKTYKVYTDSAQIDKDKSKKKGFKKNCQDYPQSHFASGSSPRKLSPILCSNSVSSTSVAQNSFLAKNSFCSFQLDLRKGNTNVPASQKAKVLPQKNKQNIQTICSTTNFSYVWNGVDRNLSTPPIPIPGKVSSECYRIQPGASETASELNESDWAGESIKTSSVSHPFSPPAFYAGHPNHDGTNYSLPMSCAFPSSAIATTATSLPLPIPGAASQPVDEVMSTSPTHCPAPMAVYPYPVYTVPGMYLVCRDGSTLPLTWGSQDVMNGSEISSGVPSVFFNTPPTGMSPPITSWIPSAVPSYGSTWPPTITPTVTFSPPPSPLEMNAYQSNTLSNLESSIWHLYSTTNSCCIPYAIPTITAGTTSKLNELLSEFH